jgi:hypothetical protein
MADRKFRFRGGRLGTTNVKLSSRVMRFLLAYASAVGFGGCAVRG